MKRMVVRKALAAIVVGGGIMGVLIVGTSVVAGPAALSLWLLLAIFGGLYVIGISLGLKLWRSGERGVLGANELYWVIQIPVIVTRWFSYRYAVGAYAALSVQLGDVGLDTNLLLGSNFAVSFGTPDEPRRLGVNVLAVVVVLLLHRMRAGSRSRA